MCLLSLKPEFIYCDESIPIQDMVNDEDTIEIVLSETNEQDTNKLSEGVSETQKRFRLRRR